MTQPLKGDDLLGPPALLTERLRLRPMTMSDADAICAICADPEIARGTLSIPHPYSKQAAEEFLRNAARGLEKETFYVWGIETRSDGLLVGDTGLEVDQKNRSAEGGFIVAKEHWGAGYATEAFGAVLDWGFGFLGLHRIHAHCMAWNAGSARVMQKAGMIEEGTLRQSILKWGRFEDARVFSMLRSEWEEKRARGTVLKGD